MKNEYESASISKIKEIVENITKQLNSQDEEEKIASQFAHFVIRK